jgi:hypothetical protein
MITILFLLHFKDTTVGKRLSPDWSFPIGEECIGDIQVLSTNDPSTSCVICSTFRNIMCFGDGGILIWQKRLDYQISYFHSFLGIITICIFYYALFFVSTFNLIIVPISSSDHTCITITTSSNEPYNCYVYEGTTLRWAAKMPFPPIHLKRVFNSYKVI